MKDADFFVEMNYVRIKLISKQIFGIYFDTCRNDT